MRAFLTTFPHPTRLVAAVALLALPVVATTSCGDGGSPTDPDDPDPGNQPPVAAFSSDALDGPAPHTVTFDAGASHDPDGEIVSYAWEFGDGSTATGVTTTHVFEAPGHFVPRLTVTDDRGASGTAVDSAVFVTAPPGDGDGTLTGTVWHDRAGDGLRAEGDPTVPGAIVFLDLDGNGALGAGEPYTVTDRQGEYTFHGVDTGASTTVTQRLGLGWTNTFAGAAAATGSAIASGATSATETASGSLMGISRIIGGSVASGSEFPFMVALIAETSSGTPFFTCGGTFVNARWVLTAAHCVDGRQPSGLRVLVGTSRRSSGGEEVPVTRIRIYPAYGEASFAGNDVALLELDRPFMIPRSALQERSRPHLSEPGTTATAVGWGLTSFNGSVSDDLRKVELALISNAQCQTMLAENVVDSTICAGTLGTTQSICSGDSGGPLLVPDGDGWVQVGVTSFGRQCQPPLAWARISEFMEWVRTTVPREPSMSVQVDWSAGDEARVDFGNFR